MPIGIAFHVLCFKVMSTNFLYEFATCVVSRYHIPMNDEQQIYASVDLELSGFDPDADEIIEIGILRFRLEAGRLTIIDSWGTLIKPTGEIRTRVLGLTGIDSVEANAAPEWSEVLPIVQDLLTGAIILGHGVDLDRKFLVAKGIDLISDTIDTLELAQIFLPTHHSYNLENLAQELQVTHTTAHRALADAEATYGVLAQLVGIYQDLPKKLQNTIKEVAAVRKMPWVHLFAAVTVRNAPRVVMLDQSNLLTQGVLAVPRGSGIVVTAPGTRLVPDIQAMRTHVPTWVVAFADRERVLSFAQSESVEPYLGAFESVSARALDELHDRFAELSPREMIAFLKVLVWQAQGSAHGILAELNWSIIGTDLKRLFTTGFVSRTPNGVAVSDFRSLVDFKDGRNVWIDQADSYIQFLEQKSGMQISWNSMLTGLRQIYNPETGYGDASKEKDIIEGIAHVDIFYARVLVLIKQELHLTTGIASPDDLGQYAWSRITLAAQNLSKKLQAIWGRGKDASLARVIDSLSAYFHARSGEMDVRWIEFSDNRCAFIVRPVELLEAFKQSTVQKKDVVLQTDVRSTLLQGYFCKRLGLSNAVVHSGGVENKSTFPKKLTVIDEGFELEVSHRLPSIKNGIVVFPTLDKLKTYYDVHYAKLSSVPAVVAVGIHGGANKVLRNFSHSKKTIVLAALPSLISFAAKPLDLSHILYVGLPHVDLHHPYYSRLAKEYFSELHIYEKNMQLLGFMQSLRAFNMEKIQFLELLVENREQQTAEFIFAESFT